MNDLNPSKPHTLTSRGRWRSPVMAGVLLAFAGVVSGSFWLNAQLSQEVASAGPAATDRALETNPVPPLTPGPQPYDGTTRYILMGGGSAPANTQVSLEEHVLRLGRILDKMNVPAAMRSILFAAGPTDEPVVEVLDESLDLTELQQVLAWVTDDNPDPQATWRKAHIPGLEAPLTREALQQALQKSHAEPSRAEPSQRPASPGSPSDTRPPRTILYFAGHGFPADDANPVSLGLWHEKQLTPGELQADLARLPPEHRVIGILTQCHSGGFGDLLYPKGDITLPATAEDRCAFFAVPPEYLAAGCTPEANRPNPDDYSSWFFSALEGQLHDGRPLPGTSDFDGDGRVSFEDAHAFARLYDGTLDIPVSTREYFLRVETRNLPLFDGLTLASPWVELLAGARPADRVVLQTLAERLKLEGEALALKARYQADRLNGELGRLDEAASPLRENLEEQRTRLKGRLLHRWPWLKSAQSPRGEQQKRESGPAILQFVEKSPEYQEYARLKQAIETLEAPVDGLERRFALHERLARAAETVVMERWLREKGSKAQVDKLDAILACEADGL